MALPVFAFAEVTGGGQFLAIQASNPPTTATIAAGQTIGPFTQPLLYDASFYVNGTAAGAVLTFQELCPDSQWRALGTPAPITTTANQGYNGSIPGEFLALRIFVTTTAGGIFLYLKASIKS